MKTKTQLVQTTTSDDLILSGLYNEGSKDKEAIVYIHGFEGDFYSNSFLHSLADSLSEAKYGFVLCQTRGTGKRIELMNGERTKGYDFGGHYEKLSEAHLDISAWINFLKQQGYSKVILVGHSLGTIKVTRYLFEGEHKDLVTKLVLFAPFDKNGYIENKTQGEWHEHVKIAEQKINEGNALEMIPSTFDDYPMTYQTYYSWYEESEINLIWDFYRPQYKSPFLESINIPVIVIIGENDEFFFTKEVGGSFKQSQEYLQNNIKNLLFYKAEGSGHTYVGHEDEVAKVAIDFIQS